MKPNDQAELEPKARQEFHKAAIDYAMALETITDGSPILMSAILWRTFIESQSRILKCLDEYMEHVVSEREKGGNDVD